MSVEILGGDRDEAGTTAVGLGADVGPILLLPGRVRVPDKRGHHDYLAGCALLTNLLQQTAGVTAITARDGWPANDALFDDASALVFYTGGLGKHAVLQSAQRIDRIEQLVSRGVGLIMIHQAVRFPPEVADRATTWIGGVHVRGRSNAGHWRTQHRQFPSHPITHGVLPWKIRDGWHNRIQFAAGMQGVTPLLWSSQEHGGAPDGGGADVVAWAYDRPDGGRAFCFTGLDAHSAWAIPGVRQMIVNGILWAAGITVPTTGAPCAVSESTLSGYLTPRGFPGQWAIDGVLRKLRRLGN